MLMALVMVLALAACGSDSTEATPMGTGTVVSADVPWYVGVADTIFQYHAGSTGSGN